MSGRSQNLSGGERLIADMTVNVCPLSIVKALGMDYPPAQLVFLHAGALKRPAPDRRRVAAATINAPGNLARGRAFCEMTSRAEGAFGLAR